MTADERTRLDIAVAAIDALEKRCGELEDEVATLRNEMDTFKACDECGAVFRNYDAYSEHACQGVQGR